MKPSSKNEVMNGIVNAYIAQKALDKANNTHYADTWKILNGADDKIDASLKFDLSEGEWADIKTYLKANNIAFTLALISYKDGHSQNSFVWYDNEHIYAVEMNEIGSVTFHVDGKVKPTDETSSSVLKMLLALENGGANGGGGETTTKQVFKGGVDILDKPLDVESKATFGADVDVDGALTINSAKDLKTKDGTSFGGGGDFYELNIADLTDEGLFTITKQDWDEIYNNHRNIKIPVSATFIYYFYFSTMLNDGETNVSMFTGVANAPSNQLYACTLLGSDAQNNYYGIVKQIDLASKEDLSTYATKTDLNAKQSTLYRHTITIYEGNTKDGNSICLTTYTPSNTPIDSIQDLTASVDGSNKLANTDLGCFGVSGTASALVFYNKIHVGTNLATTTLQKATGGSVALSNVYSTYTITDDVSLN